MKKDLSVGVQVKWNHHCKFKKLLFKPCKHLAWYIDLSSIYQRTHFHSCTEPISHHISNTVHQLGHHISLAKDIDALDWVQHSAIKLVKNLSILSYEDRLISLQLQSLYCHRQHDNLIETFKILHNFIHKCWFGNYLHF